MEPNREYDALIRKEIQKGNWAVDTPKSILEEMFPHLSQWRQDRIGLENVPPEVQEYILGQGIEKQEIRRPQETDFSHLFKEKTSLASLGIGLVDRTGKEKWQDFLTNVTETVPFMDPLYYSPQESFNDFMRYRQTPMNVGSEFLPEDSPYQTESSTRTDMWIKDEGLVDLWEKAGKPRINDLGYDPFSGTPFEKHRATYSDPHLQMYKQEDGEYKHRSEISLMSNLVGKIKKMFKTPTVNVSSKENLVSELAHAIEHRQPEIHNYYTSVEEMTEAVRKERTKMEWTDETDMYNTPGTVEHHTHSITEPKLIDTLIANFKHPSVGDEIHEEIWEQRDNYEEQWNE